MKKWTLAAAIVSLVLWKGYSILSAETATGRAKADILVDAYAHHIGAGERHLDTENDCSFGDSGLHYDSASNKLILRLYLTRGELDDPNPKIVRARQLCDAAMNDPKIGGMFDKGGGYIYRDPQKKMIFLAKDYSVDQTSAKEFLEDASRLSALSEAWFMRWFKHVCRIAHGVEAPPTHFVTLQNDPYHN